MLPTDNYKQKLINYRVIKVMIVKIKTDCLKKIKAKATNKLTRGVLNKLI